jgi:hypothetical protein
MVYCDNPTICRWLFLRIPRIIAGQEMNYASDTDYIRRVADDRWRYQNVL